MMSKKLFVLGLDAAPPSLLFEKFRDELPNFSELLDNSVYGPMRSCDPPITIPAWMVMVTGREPGTLGLYGFRHRKGFSYVDITIPNSRSIKYPKIWDYLGDNGYKSFVMGVPPTYPPYKINGWMISGFLTPNSKTNFTYPPTLKKEVEKVVGDYIFDVPFRKEDRASVLRDLFRMSEQHVKVALNMFRNKPWDFFMYMEVGLDRLQHAFWKYMDPMHPNYTPHPEFSDAILRYYKLLDNALEGFIKAGGKETAFIIVSDHGAKMMKGAFAVNDWLIQEDFLKVKGGVKPGSRFSEVDVDWKNTYAWGWGGYYARIFLNVKGREEKGVIEKEEYESFRKDLARKIKSIKGPKEESWKNHILYPEKIYNVLNGNPPDMMVYFDDLYWRSAGTFGYDNPYLPENDIGPDDAVHDYDGVFIFYDPSAKQSERIRCSIYDVTPTVLNYFNVDIPNELRGSSLLK